MGSPQTHPTQESPTSTPAAPRPQRHSRDTRATPGRDRLLQPELLPTGLMSPCPHSGPEPQQTDFNEQALPISLIKTEARQYSCLATQAEAVPAQGGGGQRPAPSRRREGKVGLGGGVHMCHCQERWCLEQGGGPCWELHHLKPLRTPGPHAPSGHWVHPWVRCGCDSSPHTPRNGLASKLEVRV